MVTFSSMTASIDTRTVQRALMILGTITACALILTLLWFVFWLVQECLQAIAEIVHLISTANPIVVSALIVLIAVWLLSKWKR